jgi:hypothetical protein
VSNTPFTAPSDISGLEAWFKADALALNDTDPVTSWTDSSGKARNATEATNPPSYRTNVVNGFPVVRFDGVNDKLQTASFPLAQPLTIFAVFRHSSLATTNKTVFDGLTNLSAMLSGQVTGPQWIAFAGTNLFDGTADTNWHVATVVFNGGSSNIRIDGGPGVTGNAGTATPSGITLGSRGSGINFFVGDIFEVTVYSSALSTTNINSVGAYLAARAGLIWTTAT